MRSPAVHQLINLYGGIAKGDGATKARVTRIIFLGDNAEQVMRLMTIVSYFIRTTVLYKRRSLVNATTTASVLSSVSTTPTTVAEPISPSSPSSSSSSSSSSQTASSTSPVVQMIGETVSVQMDKNPDERATIFKVIPLPEYGLQALALCLCLSHRV
jgi:hypothetical protein